MISVKTQWKCRSGGKCDANIIGIPKTTLTGCRLAKVSG